MIAARRRQTAAVLSDLRELIVMARSCMRRTRTRASGCDSRFAACDAHVQDQAEGKLEDSKLKA
jgi:hypothetical protein